MKTDKVTVKSSSFVFEKKEGNILCAKASSLGHWCLLIAAREIPLKVQIDQMIQTKFKR